MLFFELEVCPRTELIYIRRAGKDATQLSKVRCEDLRADNAALLVAFKSTKKKARS